MCLADVNWLNTSLMRNLITMVVIYSNSPYFFSFPISVEPLEGPKQEQAISTFFKVTNAIRSLFPTVPKQSTPNIELALTSN